MKVLVDTSVVIDPSGAEWPDDMELAISTITVAELGFGIVISFAIAVAAIMRSKPRARGLRPLTYVAVAAATYASATDSSTGRTSKADRTR